MKNCKHYYQLVSAILLSFLLVACSGDNGGSSSSAFSFAAKGPIELLVGGSNYTNIASGGSDTGAITYTSSETSIATVDEISGEVSVLSAGSTTIIATRAADDSAASATTSYTLNISSISFLDGSTSISNKGAVSKLSVDTTATITAIADGQNNVFSYTSSDPSIAQVDANTGALTMLDAGTVEITATLSSGSIYSSGSGSYQLLTTNQIPFSAWVGESDTEVTFPASTIGLDFARSRIKTCIGDNLCDSAYGIKTTLLADNDASIATPVIDSAATLDDNSQAFYWLTSSQGSSSKPTAMSLSRFSARAQHQMVVHDSKLWVIAGSNRNDTWSSTNGETWIEEANGGFPTTSEHQVVSFNDELWLLGGTGNNTNEIYRYDSIVWGSAQATSGFSARKGHRIIEFKGELWSIGGLIGSSPTNEILKSTNATAWTPVTPTGDIFSPRSGHQLFVFNNALWVIGGLNGSTRYNDIWSSSDGINWVEQSVDNPNQFPARYDHTVTEFDGKLWLIGGRWGGNNNVMYDDIWRSVDGITWTKVTDNAAFGNRASHEAVSFNNKLWLSGGDISASSKSNEIWSSEDGKNWVKENSFADFSERSHFQTEVFSGKLWLFGGTANNGLQNDVWSSTDGIDWGNESNNAGFTARQGHQIFTHDNKLWLTGGDDGQVRNHVLSSSNGIDWQPVANDSRYPSRKNHQALSFDSRMWVIGGESSLSTYGDVWYSDTSGASWSEVSTAPDFGARSNHQVAVFNLSGADTLFLTAGKTGSGTLLNDVWKSINGFDWEPATTLTPDPMFSPRTGHQSIEFKGSLYVIGGEDATGAKNDIWKTSDGSSWPDPILSAPFTARHSFQLEVYDDKLWVIGGIDDSGNKLNDVWSSDDGIIWRRGFRNSIYFSSN